MLSFAVGSMILIAWWSLPRDDAEDPATGLLALKSWSERVVSRKHNGANRRNRRPDPAETKPKRDRSPDRSSRRRRH